MTYTKGDVIVEEIKVGDVLYEFEYGFCIKSIVKTLPTQNEDSLWSWVSENVTTGKTIEYSVHPDYSHYGPNLYNTMSYDGCRII
jgi:hypothetical protein